MKFLQRRHLIMQLSAVRPNVSHLQHLVSPSDDQALQNEYAASQVHSFMPARFKDGIYKI